METKNENQSTPEQRSETSHHERTVSDPRSGVPDRGSLTFKQLEKLEASKKLEEERFAKEGLNEARNEMPAALTQY